VKRVLGASPTAPEFGDYGAVHFANAPQGISDMRYDSQHRGVTAKHESCAECENEGGGRFFADTFT
jgi:hypothetical protein